MQINDIAKIEINWMEQFANDPHVTFVLKRDRAIAKREDFRYRQYGNLFVAEYQHEVDFCAHDKKDHAGYGGREFILHMADDWYPNRTELNSCTGFNWNDTKHRCSYHPDDHTMHIFGPWSSGPVAVQQLSGIACMDVATLEGNSRETIRNFKWHQKQKKQGRNYTGTAFATNYTLDFVREAIDKLAPHVELWEGDYGWTVKMRDMPPKNTRRRTKPIGHSLMSAEQSAAIFW
jgi:hypothetical protein